jgi:hypothetical protein
MKSEEVEVKVEADGKGRGALKKGRGTVSGRGDTEMGRQGE